MISLFALLLVCSQSGAEPEASVPTRAPIAGKSGLAIRSVLTLPGDEEPSQRLSAIYTFPDRARLQVTPLAGPASERDTLYRFGEQHWALSPGRTRSRPLDAKEHILGPVHLELRRALFLWPDGFAWEHSEAEGDQPARAQAEVQIRIHEADSSSLDKGWSGSWSFFADLNEDGRPSSMVTFRCNPPEGGGSSLQLLEFRDIEWIHRADVDVPGSFSVLSQRDGPGCGRFPPNEGWDLDWTEHVERVDTSVNMLDHFFLPPDRKGDLTPTGRDVPVVAHQPADVVLRIALERDGSDWEAALAASEAEHVRVAAELEEEGLELRQERVLEVDRSGRAVAVLLRLEDAAGGAPEGWLERPRREIVSLSLEGRGAVGAATLSRLAALVPKGARLGTAWVRVATAPDGREGRQVVLPFLRGE